MDTRWELDEIMSFVDIFDVRTPAEFAQDHIPRAINLPVLSDEQRVVAGTMHKQVSVFDARKYAAPIIATVIAQYVAREFAHKQKSWKPLIYCWRGGERSKAVEIILRRIGWNAIRLPGGYKNYRIAVIRSIEKYSDLCRFYVIAGKTGVGKTMLLHKLSAIGAQVLDLEKFSNHRGSVLGSLGDQPSQKMFESRICESLRGFDVARPVFVESESRKIGKLHVPDMLLQSMRDPVKFYRINTPIINRIAYIKKDYSQFIKNPKYLEESLGNIEKYLSKKKLEQLMKKFENNDIDGFVEDMLVDYYDRLYERSLASNFRHYSGRQQQLRLEEIDEEHVKKLAITLTRDIQISRQEQDG